MAQRRNTLLLPVVALGFGLATTATIASAQSQNAITKNTRMSIASVTPTKAETGSHSVFLAIMGATPILSAASFVSGGAIIPLLPK